jgi:hypothetical protein
MSDNSAPAVPPCPSYKLGAGKPLAGRLRVREGIRTHVLILAQTCYCVNSTLHLVGNMGQKY